MYNRIDELLYVNYKNMATVEQYDNLNNELEDGLKLMDTNNDSFDVSTTFDVMCSGLSSRENAEYILTDANKKIWAAEYVLSLASNNWLWECEHANALRKDIEDIQSECRILVNKKDSYQSYIDSHKESELTRYVKKGFDRIAGKVWKNENMKDEEYERRLNALNTQISKVNDLLKRSEKNTELLFIDISKIIWSNSKN